MEVNQRHKPIQKNASQLFEDIEGRGVELEQVASAAEQHIEGPVNEELIQEFTEQEVMAQQ
jgi:hypothetical protein